MSAALDTPRRQARATTQTTARGTSRSSPAAKPKARTASKLAASLPSAAAPALAASAALRPAAVPAAPLARAATLPLNPGYAVAATLGEQLALAAGRRNAAVAYIEGEERHTWPEVDQASDRLACGLLGLGLKRGDRIGVLALNQIEWLMLFYAAARIGVAVVALSPRYRDSDLAHMLADSEAKVVFSLRQHDGFDLVAMLGRLQPQLPKLRHVIQIGGEGLTSFASVAGTPVDITRLAQARRQVTSDDLAMVIYTSGSTGRPKGAALSHRNLLASAAAQAAHLKITDADLLHMANPLEHVGGITCGALAHLVGGGSLVIVAEFKAERVLSLMARHRPTLVAGVPSMLTLMLLHASVGRVDFSQVRVVFSGGAPVDGTLLERLAERMPQAQLMQLYGLSETAGGVVMSPWHASRAELIGSIGQPFHGVSLRVVDSMGQVLPAGEVGELCLQGPSVAAGYIGAGAGQGLGSDGWLMTGDLGLVDARGLVTLKGRKKDMYIQGGFNVYPAEIEALLNRHPKVLMSAVIGLPDAVLGEVGRLYVVARPDSGLRESDIRRWCSEQLADYKVPRDVVLRTSLPMTPTGKIHKAALRDELARH